MTNVLYCSYYTKNTGYELEALRLQCSLNKFGLSYSIVAIDSFGSWDLNTRYKAEFLRYMLAKHERPLVFLDADAEVMESPVLFETLDCDIGVHKKRPVEVQSGTIYLNNNENVRKLLDLWILENNNAHISQFEQYNLGLVLQRKECENIRMENLPEQYCYIDRISKCGDPVIYHHQASRRLKKIVNDLGRS